MTALSALPALSPPQNELRLKRPRYFSIGFRAAAVLGSIVLAAQSGQAELIQAYNASTGNVSGPLSPVEYTFGGSDTNAGLTYNQVQSAGRGLDWAHNGNDNIFYAVGTDGQVEAYNGLDGSFITSGTSSSLSGGTRGGEAFNNAFLLGTGNNNVVNIGYYLGTGGTVEAYNVLTGGFITAGSATELSGGSLDGTLLSDTSLLIGYGNNAAQNVAYYLNGSGMIEAYNAFTGGFIVNLGETSVSGGLADGESYSDLFAQGRLLGMANNASAGGNANVVYIGTALASVPEPSSLLLGGMGLCGLMILRRRKRPAGQPAN